MTPQEARRLLAVTGHGKTLLTCKAVMVVAQQIVDEAATAFMMTGDKRYLVDVDKAGYVLDRAQYEEDVLCN